MADTHTLTQELGSLVEEYSIVRQNGFDNDIHSDHGGTHLGLRRDLEDVFYFLPLEDYLSAYQAEDYLIDNDSQEALFEMKQENHFDFDEAIEEFEDTVPNG